MKKIDYYTLLLATVWHVTVFLKIPHLTWLPSFLNTWFYENGLTYYKDFLQAHFPVPHLIAYPFLKITNWNLETGPIMSLVLALLVVIIIYKYTSGFLSLKAKSTAIVYFSLFYWMNSTWIQYSGEAVIGLFLLVAVILLINLKSTLSSFFFALSLALTELSGQISSITVTTIGLIYLYLIRDNFKNHFARFFVGFSIPFLAIVIYFISKNAFSDFFYWNVSYYLEYASQVNKTSQSLPLREIATIFSPAFLLGILMILRRFRMKKQRAVVIVTVASLSSLVLITKSIFHPHHYLFILPTLSLAAGLSLDLMREYRAKHRLVAIAVLVVTSYVILQTTLVWYGSRIKPGLNPQILTALTWESTQGQAVAWMLDNSSSSSTILVTGDPMFYFYAKRLPSNNRYSALPWHFTPLDRSKKIVENNLPEYWVVDNNYMERLIKGWNTPEIAELIVGLIQNNYKRKYTNGDWEIWKLSGQ